MGGNTLTLALREKPEQDNLDQFVKAHPRARAKSRLGDENSVVIEALDAEEAFHTSFEVWGPLLVFEGNDLPPELATLVPAPCWTLQVTLEETQPSPEDWELANSFARFIATACNGAIYHDELGKIAWSKIAATPKPVEQNEKLDLVSYEWFVSMSRPTVQTSEPLLSALRALFPQAVPVRFGTTEPLQHRLQEEGDESFDRLWRESRDGQRIKGLVMGMIFFTGRQPCFGGHISFPNLLSKKQQGDKPEAQYVEVKLGFDRKAFTENRASAEKLVSLFVEVSKRLGAFYGRGFVERNYSSYRGLCVTPETERYPLPIGHQWLGIPPAPTWLTWLGPAYAELVQDSVRNVPYTTSPEGMLIQCGPEPMDMDQLAEILLEFPSSLLARVRPGGKFDEQYRKEKKGRWPYRGEPAETIPRLDA